MTKKKRKYVKRDAEYWEGAAQAPVKDRMMRNDLTPFDRVCPFCWEVSRSTVCKCGRLTALPNQIKEKILE